VQGLRHLLADLQASWLLTRTYAPTVEMYADQFRGLADALTRSS
jgi:hypothetical protein